MTKARATIVSAEVSAQHHPQGSPLLVILLTIRDERGFLITADRGCRHATIASCAAATAHLFTDQERNEGLTLGGLVGREVEFDAHLLGLDLASLRSVGIPADGGRS